MSDDLFDLRTYFDRVWLERYESFIPTAYAWWKDHSQEKSDFGVDATTIRAVRGGEAGKNGPLSIYNKWAKNQLDTLLRDKHCWEEINSFEGFERWHQELVRSLNDHWSSVESKGIITPESDEDNIDLPLSIGALSIAHRYKLVDLFVRYLRVNAPLDSILEHAILAFAHIPLDRKSISLISATFGDIALSPDFRMGMVKTEAGYRTYQRLVRAICAEVGGSPILFDVFAWNHPDAQKLYARP